MGLDGVEIVMKVEERFDIVIEDSEAEKIVTPGQLIDLILSKVGRTTHAACLTQRAFYRLRASMIQSMSFTRGQIRPEVPLSDLFPRTVRKQELRRVLTHIGLRKDFEFVRPPWLIRLILGTSLCGGIGLAVFLWWHPVSSENILVNFAFDPALAGVFFCGIVGWMATCATRRLRAEFKPSMTNIAHLSRWIVANAPHVVEAPPGQWSREQVSDITRQIVVDMLACEKDYREDAHFVKDLGLS